MIKYHRNKFNLNILNKYNIDRMAVESVPNKSYVLDVGCATGYIGEYLIKQKNCRVIGIENNSEEVMLAKKRLTKVINLDIESEDAIMKIHKATNNKKFDLIYATSLIEHLKNPDQFLLSMRKIMKKNGKIIISTPNISHWKIVVDLLRGEFKYSKYGILDKTHLVFFTIKSFVRLLKDNGYKVQSVRLDCVGGGFPKISRCLCYVFPNLFTYQILICAKT